MNKGIYVCIKPEYFERILSGEKNYEFRSFYPKEKIDKLYVYVSGSRELKYIIYVDKVVEYPSLIDGIGYGNNEFNKGSKRKYAYHIKNVYCLKNGISLNDLRSLYSFYPPQGYAYDTKYEELTKYINNSEVIKLV